MTRSNMVDQSFHRVLSPSSYVKGFLIALLICCAPAVFGAASDTLLTSAQQQPAPDALREIKQDQLASLKGQRLQSSSVELANLELETARASLNALEIELRGLPKTVASATEASGSPGGVKAQDFTDQKALDEYRQAMSLAIAEQRGRTEVLENWVDQLRRIYTQQQTESSQSAWEEQKAKLLDRRSDYLKRGSTLKDQLSDSESSRSLEQLQTLRIRALDADERASLISQDIQIKSARISLDKVRIEMQTLDEASQVSLAALDTQLGRIRQDLEGLTPIIQRKLELLEKYQSSSSVLSKEQQKIVEKLISDYQEQLLALSATTEAGDSIATQLMDLQALANKQLLSARYSWPDTMPEWLSVANELATGAFALARDGWQMVGEIFQKPPVLIIRMLIVVMVSVGLLTFIRFIMTPHLPQLNRLESSYSRWMSALYMRMVHRNLYTLFVLVTVPAAMWLLDIPFERYRAIYWILVVVIVTKPLLNLNHTLFTQRKIGLEWYDRPLYRGLQGSILLGAALIILTLITRYSDVSSITSETISRLLMLAMLVGSAVVLWRRTSILKVLAEALEDRPKIFFLLKLATLTFPVAGLATGFIGLLGYTNLAWLLARYEGVVLAVLIGWMTARGFLIDFFKAWYARSTRKMPNGWIFAQAVVRPLEILVRTLLILIAVGLAFNLLGLSGDSSVVSRLREVLNTTLFSVGESDITLWSVLVVIASSGIFLWAAKWSREFAYRWLYRRILDHGIRNSLAVFTQYAVVLFGLFLLLKILGIDLTALAVLAGAIGVGIGFGLQTIANNFISGILLLIERPFRTGDIINIGGNEGEVTRIGIRSLSVKTWDNTEVIIPNTETMTSAFVNWTHQDNIIRVLEYIGVSYDADPHEARQIIENIINGHEAVLKNPEPHVLLSAFADSSVNFRVQFFVDIARHSRLQVKSEILFSIWDAFKEAGIEIPFPQQDLHLRSVSSEAFGRLSTRAPDSPDL